LILFLQITEQHIYRTTHTEQPNNAYRTTEQPNNYRPHDQGATMSFFDSDKFLFVAQDDGHLIPVHYRELGSKEGHLYSKKVSWVDATINNVPLEQTFSYEDEIAYIKATKDEATNGFIVVNERPSQSIPVEEDIPQIHQKKKWLNRLDKLTLQPMTLPQAKKKKKGHQRFPVKPKTEVQKETYHHSYDKFHDLVDTKSSGILGSFIYKIHYKDGYEKRVSWDDGDWRGDNVKKEVRYIPKYKERTYCPPEHWLTPVVQWKNIWLEMDEIERGYKRDYVYVSEGELCPDSTIMGPAIYFFDTICETVEEYEKEWIKATKYWITGNLHNNHTHRWLEINDSSRLSDASYLERVENEYLKNPSEETLNNYQDGWRLTQPGYEGYYRSGAEGWIFKIFPSYHQEAVPHPHL
jgi:hypothetical protein